MERPAKRFPFRAVCHKASYRGDPLLGGVCNPDDRKSALVGQEVAANHGVAQRAVFEQLEVALAFVEVIVLDRGQRQIEIECG